MKHAMLTKLVVAISLIGLLGGCASLEVGTKARPHKNRDWSGVTACFTVALFEKYEGEMIKAGVFGYAKNPFEIASVDVWPVAGVAIGLAGARVRVIPFEVGFGVLGYDPKPTPAKVEPAPVPTPAPQP